ncbi:MAG: hypothetical protein QXT58_01940 [Archaeoglobaceae archaeon]
MSELFSALVGVIAFIVVMALKPEWFIGWLVELFKKKFPEREANKVTNALGIKLIEAGVYALTAIPDKDIADSVQIIKLEVAKIKKALFSLN